VIRRGSQESTVHPENVKHPEQPHARPVARGCYNRTRVHAHQTLRHRRPLAFPRVPQPPAGSKRGLVEGITGTPSNGLPYSSSDPSSQSHVNMT